MSIVENFDLYAPRLIDKGEYFSVGHTGCAGCGEALATRLVLKGLGKDTVVSNATGCLEIISSRFPTTAWEIPWIHVAFENAAAVAAAFSNATCIQGISQAVVGNRLEIISRHPVAFETTVSLPRPFRTNLVAKASPHPAHPVCPTEKYSPLSINLGAYRSKFSTILIIPSLHKIHILLF